MRVVITQKGLDVCQSLRKEGEGYRRLTPHRPVSASKAIQTRRESERLSTRLSDRMGKVRSKYEKMITERDDIMRRIRRKVEKQREIAQIAEISYYEVDRDLPSLAVQRAIYLRNLREEQEGKYSKAWRWVDSRGFASVRRTTKSSPSHPRGDTTKDYGM